MLYTVIEKTIDRVNKDDFPVDSVLVVVLSPYRASCKWSIYETFESGGLELIAMFETLETAIVFAKNYEGGLS